MRRHTVAVYLNCNSENWPSNSGAQAEKSVQLLVLNSTNIQIFFLEMCQEKEAVFLLAFRNKPCRDTVGGFFCLHRHGLNGAEHKYESYFLCLIKMSCLWNWITIKCCCWLCLSVVTSQCIYQNQKLYFLTSVHCRYEIMPRWFYPECFTHSRTMTRTRKTMKNVSIRQHT